MRYGRAQIEKIAADFRAKAGLPQDPPYDIAKAAKLILPLQVIEIAGLDLEKIRQWLRHRNLVDTIDDIEAGNRTVHGFILTQRGSGLIFVDSEDLEAEQRFTIAHEVSHFLIDHKIPRQKIISRFGDRLEKIMDGELPLKRSDELFALIKGADIHQRTRSIENDGDGSFRSWINFIAENEADGLALELLAPQQAVVSEILSGKKSLPHQVFTVRCRKLLEQRYGLPTHVAQQYAAELAYFVTNGTSLLRKLGYKSRNS